MTYGTFRSNHAYVFQQNLVQRFVGPPSLQNHIDVRDEVLHSPQKVRQVFKNHRNSYSKYREVKQQKIHNAGKYSLVYVFFVFKNVGLLFCCHSRGRYSANLTYGTSVLWEVSEVIEEISTAFSTFPNLLNLFLLPCIFKMGLKNLGLTSLFLN